MKRKVDRLLKVAIVLNVVAILVVAGAIAVAPVTHWKYYDNIYTERYNGLPQENAAGYERGSPLTYAGQLTGDLLVVHGTGDEEAIRMLKDRLGVTPLATMDDASKAAVEAAEAA